MSAHRLRLFADQLESHAANARNADEWSFPITVELADDLAALLRQGAQVSAELLAALDLAEQWLDEATPSAEITQIQDAIAKGEAWAPAR